MNKRIRKKRHLGEFNVIDLSVSAIINGMDHDQWLDKFIEFIESVNLSCCGGANKDIIDFGIVKHIERKTPNGRIKHRQVSVGLEDAEKLVSWLTANGATDINFKYELGWGHRRKPAKHEMVKHGLS